MKLYEEFKLVEDMWEDDTVNVLLDKEDPFAELPSETQDFANKRKADEITKANAGTNSVLRTFGRKTYNLADTNELFAWWRANLEFQMKRYPDRYKGYRGNINDYKLHVTIANNLIAKLQADGVTDEKIFKELRGMAAGNEYMATKSEERLTKATRIMYDVAKSYLGDNIRKVDWASLKAIVERTTDSFITEISKLPVNYDLFK